MKVEFGPCVLDTDSRVLLRAGVPVHVTPKAFKLLTVLAEAQPRAVSKAELQDKLWPDVFVSESNLAVIVKEARAAIGDNARQPVFIRTVHGYGYAFGTPQSDKKTTPAHSLLVLPLANNTGNADLDYLCDGIAENVINAFSRVATFRVMSWQTASRWKNSDVDASAIGRQLNVTTVIQGRVDAGGDKLSVQIGAIDVDSATQMWGHRFRGSMSDLYRIEEDVASEIVDALQVRLDADDQSRLVRRFTSNAHAYDLYLRGRYHWKTRTEEGLSAAIEHFERAIVADPSYALPHSGLADAWIATGSRDLIPPRVAFARAHAAATRAIELAPSLAEAHASLAAVAEVHDWNWDDAGRKYRRAIELGPGSANTHQWYALHLARQIRHEEAQRQMTYAVERDPLSHIILTNAGLIAYLARESERAASWCESALELAPDDAGATILRGLIYELAGDMRAAIACDRRAAALSSRHTMSLATVGHVLARAGEIAEAEQILQRLEAMRQSQHVSACDSAIVALGLGRSDEALDWLERALDEKSAWLVYLKTDARLDPLRSHPRFARVLALTHSGTADALK